MSEPGDDADYRGQPADASILARIRSFFESADPVPPGLHERVRFRVAVARLQAEAAAIVAEAVREDPVLARGTAEESRTITFDSTELTIMIRIDSNADDTVRLDGWLAPPRRCQVEVASPGGFIVADVGADGRFVFPQVPHGTIRLIVRPPDRDDQREQQEQQGPQPEQGAQEVSSDQGTARPKTVITPALVLLAPCGQSRRD
jgi:hypothetical protein